MERSFDRSIQSIRMGFLCNKGTDAVEVISLDMNGLEDEGIDLSPQVFDNMHNLRFLLFHGFEPDDVKVHLSKGLNCLPNKLMVLHWLEYPLRALPSNFNPKQLVKLDLSYSNIEQFWEETKGFGKSSNAASIFLLGNKIPEWFSCQSPESSVNIQVLRNDLVNRKFMGIAVCAVLGFEECGWYSLYVSCDFCIYHGHIKINDGLRYSPTYGEERCHSEFRDSEHMFLGYCSFSLFYSSFQNPKKLPISDSDYLDISIEFQSTLDGRTKLKCCAAHPIYAEEPSEIIGATVQEIGETSGRSDRSDENDEELEPLPKGFNQDH
ncbi:hypothetical protein LWI29_038177 [Acer saccharum]|uniref:C-JID domain-containing protein n=1 Tax=Acer saccharum TaxID=4024 RepID=A0AA39SQ12_ACESA|nr:hypothetical protein LWI29_038177 [Acer saccharum]